MSASTAAPAGYAPGVLRELIDRFDPHVIDVPGGRARIRLEVTDGDSWDVLVRGAHAWLEPPVVALHGLGGTKASFLPTLAALADAYRVIAVDLPGFGESDKPIGAAYDAPWFARATTALLDALGIERAHLVGNSMGGRVAIEH